MPINREDAERDRCDVCGEYSVHCECEADSAVAGGYFDSIVKDPAAYNGIEVQGVRDDDSGGMKTCEVDNENPEFFSVYAHLAEGGVECVGDFTTREEALAYGREKAALYGWPMDDFTIAPRGPVAD